MNNFAQSVLVVSYKEAVRMPSGAWLVPNRGALARFIARHTGMGYRAVYRQLKGRPVVNVGHMALEWAEFGGHAGYVIRPRPDVAADAYEFA